MRRLVQVAALLLLLLGTACTNIYTPTPSMATATLPPLATFTPRYTATPVPSVTQRPTLTQTPSVTPVPPTASNTPTPTPTPPVIGQVSSAQSTVNMREGPGVTFPAIVGVVNNTDLIVLAANEEETWYNVRLEDGTEGWIAANLISVQPSPTPQPTHTAPGVVAAISGTPVATSLLGGLPVTATPSVTPDGLATDEPGATSTRRTPGTVTTTPSPTESPEPGANIPTITAGPSASVTSTEQAATPVQPPANGTVAPARQGYDILAYCEQFGEYPPVMAEGATVDVFWGWLADTEAYIQQHINNVIYEVRFDGNLLDNWRLYADEISQRADGKWQIYWYVPITEPLEAGEHTISYRVSWRNPIFDGQQQYGPGTDTEFEVGSCTITIQ